MNQQCKVCGEPAAGFHFGAFTCEGCKSFFGRTYNNLSSISECKNNGCCVINKKNRTSCKACRLRKCLMVGMSKSGSRYGRRSNWFKIHCLLQEKQQQHQQSHQQQQQKNNIFFPPNSIYPQEAFFNGHLMPPRKHEESSSEDSATSSPHPQTSPAFFPNPAFFLANRFTPDSPLVSRKRKHGGDSSSEDSTHSSSQNNIPSPHPHTPPMFFPNPSLFRFPVEPLLTKRFEDNSSEDSAASSRHLKRPGFYPSPLPSRVTPPVKEDLNSSSDDSNPAPSDVYHRRLSATVMLASSANMFTPSARPGLPHVDPAQRVSGGAAGMCSPAVGGCAVEQDQPIDLSVKSATIIDTPVKLSDEEPTKRGCKDGVLDLTNKRTANVMI